MRCVADLEASERDAMYDVLTRNFEHVTYEQFEQDLAEKEWAVTLHDHADGQIRGFSTLMRLPACFDGQHLLVFFSGDTIIEPDYWGDPTFLRLWARHVVGVAAACELPAYWFLICSGYKTYRFLPVFFREFYPTYTHPTPPATQRLLDSLARTKFPTEYDATTGIVRPFHPAPLRVGLADLTPERLRDPHVAFFAAVNPGHTRGDELACLARIAPANLTTAGRRISGL